MSLSKKMSKITLDKDKITKRSVQSRKDDEEDLNSHESDNESIDSYDTPVSDIYEDIYDKYYTNMPVSAEELEKIFPDGDPKNFFNESSGTTGQKSYYSTLKKIAMRERVHQIIKYNKMKSKK